MVGLITAASDDVTAGGLVAGDLHVSTVSDTIIVLQYVGRESTIARGLTVLKMRGSDHDKALREYVIDDHGMHIGEPLALAGWTRLPQAL